MIYGRDAISRGQDAQVLGFGPSYTGGGFIGALPDPAQLNAQQQAITMQAQAMAQAQQQLAQAQMAQPQQQVPMYMGAHIDALWAKLLNSLSASPLADNSDLFADVSAVVIQSFAPDSMSQEALKRWAVQYTEKADAAQQQQPEALMIEAPMTVPPQMQIQKEQTAQQQQIGRPFIAGRWRNRR